MCSSNPSALLPYGLKIPTPTPYFPFTPSVSHLPALDFQRPQLCDYSSRLQYGIRGYPSALGLSPYHTHLADPYAQAYLYKHDLRARYIQEEPKPSHSYIGLIAMAILSVKDKKLILSDIYQWILDNYPYFRTRGPGWRNSIRHNLSLNDCFIKSGRSANGKGHYWAIHPANVDDFSRGDFRRRRAQRKVRKHMGLAVPDDEDSPSPSPTPQATWEDKFGEDVDSDDKGPEEDDKNLSICREESTEKPLTVQNPVNAQPVKKRLFDMESILAPENKPVLDHSALSRPIVMDQADDTLDIVSDGETVDICETDNGDKPLWEGEGGRDSQPTLAVDPRETSSSVVGSSPAPSLSPSRSMDRQDTPPIPDTVPKRSDVYPWSLAPANRSRPSAFHSTAAGAWETYTTYIYPMLSSSAYPVVLPGSSLSVEAATRWREAMLSLASDSASRTDAGKR